MKTKNIPALAIICCLATVAYSQNSQPMQQGSPLAQHEMTAIKKQVSNITADQEAKLSTIEETYAKGMEEVRTSNTVTRDAMRNKIRNLREDRNYKIHSVLTPEQYAQYQNMPENRNDNSDNNNNGQQ